MQARAARSRPRQSSAPALAAALVALAACAAPSARPPQAASAAGPVAGPAADAAPPAGVPMQVGPTGLALPVWLGRQSLPERRFAVAASRALRQIHDEDHDDTALIDALVPRLADDDLAAVAATWAPLLEAARLRAEALAAMAPGVRALRRAYADAYYDEMAQCWRQVDAAACRQAHAALDDVNASRPEFVLTIEPVGPWPLAKLLAACRT